MDDFVARYGTDRQQQIQKMRRKKAKQRKLRFLLFSVVCVAALMVFIGLSLNGGQTHTGKGQASSATEWGRYDTVTSTIPADDRQIDADETQFLILVNKGNPIPDNYMVDLTELSNGQEVDSRIYQELQAMFDAARADGIYPTVAAGYRTTEKQQRLMDEKIAELRAEGYSQADAKTEAERWVAVPGTSEHQLGLAVDINADGIHSAGYDVYEWLAENAHEYGFILRYPENKEGITGTAYEAWHYRYVGVEAATEIFENELCLEEYLEQQN